MKVDCWNFEKLQVIDNFHNMIEERCEELVFTLAYDDR